MPRGGNSGKDTCLCHSWLLLSSDYFSGVKRLLGFGAFCGVAVQRARSLGDGDEDRIGVLYSRRG